MTDFGSDISTFPDLDPLFIPQAGIRVVAEALLRRLQTPRGGLVSDPDYGLDVRLWLNEGFDLARLSRLRAEIESELTKDERVDSVDVTVAFDSRAFALRITASVVTASGPFTLVLSADRLSVSALQVLQ